MNLWPEAIKIWATFLSLVLFSLGHLRPSLGADTSRPIVLRDVSAECGVDFVHTDGSSGRHYIVETVCSGLALFDYDGDGDEDLYFLSGAALPGTRFDRPARNRQTRRRL